MKKILFIHNTAAEYRIPFFEKLSKKINVKFYFTKMSLNEKIYGNKPNYSKLDKLNYRSLKNKFNICFELIPIMFKEEYDGAFIPSMDNFSEFIDALVALFILKYRGKKIFYFTEKWEPNMQMPLKKKLKNTLRKVITKPFITRVDGVVCSGTKAREYMIDTMKVDKEKCFIAYDASEVENTENYDNIRKELEINNKYIVMYYGRIIERKGLHILIKAFRILQDTGLDAFLLICGDGDYREACEKISQELEIKNIKFIGAVNPKYREKYFSQVDVFVLPSINCDGTIEAWGLTVNEAMSKGVPVIATNVVGAAFDIIENDVNGFMIEENNIQELSNSLIKCLSSKDSIEKMKSNALKTIDNNFNYNTMVEGFIKCINLTLK